MPDEPKYPDTEGKLLQQRVDALEDYIVNLHRYIRWALGHIDANNMTRQTAEKLSEVKGMKGQLSQVQQTAETLGTKITGLEGDVSQVQQTAESISLSVENNDGQISLKLNGGGGGEGSIDLTGLVKFSDLSTEGKTEINGSNITTGTLSAIDIRGCDILSESDAIAGNGYTDVKKVHMSNGELATAQSRSIGGQTATTSQGATLNCDGMYFPNNDDPSSGNPLARAGINRSSGLPVLELRSWVAYDNEAVPIIIQSEGTYGAVDIYGTNIRLHGNVYVNDNLIS